MINIEMSDNKNSSFMSKMKKTTSFKLIGSKVALSLNGFDLVFRFMLIF